MPPLRRVSGFKVDSNTAPKMVGLMSLQLKSSLACVKSRLNISCLLYTSAPTKSNGQRTRNLPKHAPDKWLTFKKYNIRDVETEMSIQARLSKYPVPDSVWEEYHLDQEINDRGVGLDMELVRQAIQMDGRSRSELTQAMKELTSLDNPNSVQQIKQWLANNGVETDTLGKKAVAELLKTAPPQLQKVLTPVSYTHLKIIRNVDFPMEFEPLSSPRTALSPA